MSEGRRGKQKIEEEATDGVFIVQDRWATKSVLFADQGQVNNQYK